MRSFRAVLILGLVLSWSAGAVAGELSPYLELLKRSERLRAVRAPVPASLQHPAARLRAAPPPLHLLVRTADPDRTRAAVRGLGGQAGKAIGDILPVRMPATDMQSIAALAARPEVARVEARPPVDVHLDRTRPELGADRVEAGADLPLPVDGSGVIAALVDTGLDYKHADFADSRGRTRVWAIWDQAFGSGDPPPGQTEGAYCDRASLTGNRCTSIDIISHGTHVSSTMAGSGQVYRGMAPGADLMAVASIDFALLTESVAWLFEQAEQAGQPMVVNLSLGGHYGPHDGSSLESQALSALTGPGRIIVASAGNEGADRIHLGYDPDGQTGKTLFYVFTGFDVNVALFTAWLSAGADLAFAIGVQDENGEVAETEFLPGDGSYRAFNLVDGATSLGRVQIEPAAMPNPDNAKRQVDILVEPTAATVYGNADRYIWYIKVQGTGAFDMWSAASGFATPPARFSDSADEGLVPGDNNKSLGMPAAAAGVIAVGSYATRAAWVDHEGQAVAHEETHEGDISFFSSLGPSADPDRTGHKPWIAGPGEYIIAALSASSGPLEEGTRIDATHVAMRGTSMSGPHLAGIVALLLEVDPTLDPNEVRRILARSARRDDFTGTELPDHTWGYGKADAFGAVATALGVGVCEANLDCAAGYRCGPEGLCQKKASGCQTGGDEPSPALPWLGLLLLALLTLRRR